MTYRAKLVVPGKVEYITIEADDDIIAYRKAHNVASTRFANQSVMVLNVERVVDTETGGSLHHLNNIFGKK